jgi:hypothetical protein
MAAVSSQQRRLWWSSVVTNKSWSWELPRLEVQSSAGAQKASSLRVGAALHYEKPDATSVGAIDGCVAFHYEKSDAAARNSSCHRFLVHRHEELEHPPLCLLLVHPLALV